MHLVVIRRSKVRVVSDCWYDLVYLLKHTLIEMRRPTLYALHTSLSAFIFPLKEAICSNLRGTYKYVLYMYTVQDTHNT